MRITIFTFHDCENVYFTIEQPDSYLKLTEVHKSEIFDNIDVLRDDLTYFIDITEYFVFLETISSHSVLCNT